MKSGAERARAARIRKAVADGRASASDAEWLSEYEAGRSGRGGLLRVHAAEPAPSPPPAVESPPTHAPAPAPQAPPSAAPPAAPKAWATIDFGQPQAASTALAAPTCTIPDCPACKTQRGAQICATTGQRVWPPMSEAGAKALASTLLGALAMLVRFVRGRLADGGPPPFIVPTDRERDDFARAIRELALRRASWIGAIDDILAVLFVGGAFARRAMTAQPKEAADGARAS